MDRTNSSENTILTALAQAEGRMLRFGDLVKATQLSQTTVSKVLKNLQKEKKVERILDSNSKVYPPPVFYKSLESDEIIQKRNFTAQVWADKIREGEELMTLFFKGFVKIGRTRIKMVTAIFKNGLKKAPLSEIPKAIEKIIQEAEAQGEDH